MIFIRIDAIAMNLTFLGFGTSFGFLLSIINLVACASSGISPLTKHSLMIFRKLFLNYYRSLSSGFVSASFMCLTIESGVQSLLVALSNFMSCIACINSSI